MRYGISTVLAIALLLPAVSGAVPRPPEPRLHPDRISALPSHVRRVEPAVVGLRIHAEPDAPSSARLGAQRFASAVVFDERGYAVTVSYAVLDALSVQATTRDRGTVPATLIGIDFESGLGLVKLDGEGPWRTAALASSADVAVGALTGTVGLDEDDELVHVTGRLQSVRRFSASWEYMLERALFVAPGSPSWGGSAVVDDRGQVIGIASLRLGEAPHVNLAIPIERFLAVKDELIATGRVVSRPPRPWLGLYTVARQGQVLIDGFAVNGPARSAGFLKGDRIVKVNGVGVRSQEEFYEELWRGQAGDLIRVAVERDARVHVIEVRSADRARGVHGVR